MNKLVIFDLDGTLCNTLPDIAYYANESLEKFGYAPKQETEIRNLVCLSIEEIFCRLMGKKEDSPIAKQATAYYKKHIKESKSPRSVLYENVDDLLLGLKSAGYKLAILTNKAADETEVIYQRLLSNFEFDAVIGLKEGVAVKPDPTEIFNLMKKFGVDKQSTYFVGDGDTDVLAALNAEVNLIAVTYGYRDKDYLQGLGATTFADNPKEILSLITKD